MFKYFHKFNHLLFFNHILYFYIIQLNIVYLSVCISKIPKLNKIQIFL